jgi:tartrate-resistant acid phosphatase type 5
MDHPSKSCTLGVFMYLNRLALSLILIILFSLGTVSAQTSERSMGSSVLHQPDEMLRFAVIGDFGSEGPTEKGVAELVKSWNPEFIITMGDNNYSCGSSKTIDRNIGQYYHEYIYPYKGRYGQGATKNRFFPSLGNHDWALACPGGRHKTCGMPTAEAYLDYFTLPGNERYYDFTWGPVHFFAINSDCNEPDGNTKNSKQAKWLQKRLAESTARWKVVYFHHPPYSSGAYKPGVANMRWPFKEWGATVVMSGHDHNYERLEVDRLTYFVNGLGGVKLRPLKNPKLSETMQRFAEDHGAMLVTANLTSLTFKVITQSEGKEIDGCTITAMGNTGVPSECR